MVFSTDANMGHKDCSSPSGPRERAALATHNLRSSDITYTHGLGEPLNSIVSLHFLFIHSRLHFSMMDPFFPAGETTAESYLCVDDLGSVLCSQILLLGAEVPSCTLRCLDGGQRLASGLLPLPMRVATVSGHLRA
ncbi:hypothetical protein G7046_g1306 [Stylonectria norvegica]|nr:hypothetical protein G7046_g1306 [Stylonectria norvegica]